MKKIKKLFKTPGIFFRDYFNKKYPKVFNEIKCPKEEEATLINHDFIKEAKSICNFPVDVVFTWVDNSDPAWVAKKQKHLEESLTERALYSTDDARFSNHDELKYSVRSILKNIKWVRNIFIVTDNQVPTWHDKTSKRIIFIDHKDIINEKFLPTFNSHVIEAHLHLINGLSENFIYFNDDVFVAREINVGHFFKSKDISSLFLSEKSLKLMRQRGVHTPTLQASTFSCELLRKKYFCEIDTPLVHTYVPLKKSCFEKAWEIYPEEINSFLHSKFRGNNDLNLATFLVPWLSYLEGKSVIERDICYYFNIRSTASRKFYNELLTCNKNKLMPHSFCANDFTSETNKMPHYKEALQKTLSEIYPSCY